MKTVESLNQGLRSGDYDSYKVLFLKCYGKLLSFVNSIVKDRQTSEDIVQEQFMKLWNNRATIDDSMSVESFLYVMAKNATINYIKSHCRFKPIQDNDSSILSSFDMEHSIDASLFRLQLQDVIDQMPPQRKKVFTMSRIDGMSNIGIAAKLGLSVKTVDRHLALAKAFINKNMCNPLS